MRIALATGFLVLLTSFATHAYKPGPPRPTITYTDASKSVSLILSNSGWTLNSVKLVEGKMTRNWSGTYRMPHRAFIAAKAKKVLFFGRHGNGCSSLGKVKVYDFGGTLLKELDLSQSIANLKKLSRTFTRICCPCFWLASVTLSAQGNSVVLNVCKKKRVTISLSTLKVETVSKIP